MEEPLPGYHVHQRIGAGATARCGTPRPPAGITKAIKIVFGYHDDERAARELTALNRIKEVRHPFVLSLERIELIDGHLIIVTELATAEHEEPVRTTPRGGARAAFRAKNCWPISAMPPTPWTTSARNIRCNTWTSSPKTCCWSAGG